MSATDAEGEGQAWLRYATEDLTTADLLLSQPRVPPRQACFLAQQAAEKALKAGLIFLQQGFPRTHDLETLRNLLPLTFSATHRLPELSRLTVWTTTARYADSGIVASAMDARGAVSLARRVLLAVESDLRQQALLKDT